jgi:hypothetical protein
MSTTPSSRKTRSNSTPNTNVSLSDIKALIESTKNQLFGKLTQEVDRLSGLLTTVLHRIEELDKKTTHIEKSCLESHACLEREISEMKRNNEENITELMKEMEERIQRSGNIIIFGLPEQCEGTAEERRSRDADAVDDLLGKIDEEVPSSQSLQIHRLGRPREDRPRPLRVTGFTTGQKIRVIRSSKSLRSTENYKNVFVNTDFTLRQQREARALRAELKQRRENGENDLVIYNGKITSKSQLTHFH